MWLVIHLQSATDRLPLIQELKDKMGHVTLFYAEKGEGWLNDPTTAKKHPYPPHQTVRQGEVGCTHSHVWILRAANATAEDVGIFEDDCEVFDGYSAKEFLRVTDAAYPEADIILLGATEYVESLPLAPRYKRVTRFWGAHAMLIRRKALHAILKTYDDGLAAGIFYPADWLYNEAIKRYGLFVVGPEKPKTFCRQRPGLVSGITGIVRQ